MTTLTESKISDIYSHLPSMFLTQENSKLKLEQTHTIFFKGKVKNIFLFRDLLTLLSDIVESRFYKPEFKRFFDPVITCEDDKLRMECFSSDTSIYCRVDLVKELFEEYSNIYRGTTNVNFNKNFLDSLASLRNSSETFFEVGKENVVLEVNDKKVKEKKVKLPDRWIRGFLESQAIYRKAEKVFELKGLASKKFLADCSLSMKDKEYFLVSKNSGIELLANQPKNGVFIPVQGLSRLSILKKIIPHVNGLTVYWVKETGATLWLIKTDGGNISFALEEKSKKNKY